MIQQTYLDHSLSVLSVLDIVQPKREVTCIVRQRQMRLSMYVARLSAEDAAHRIRSCRSPWLRQFEAYSKVTGMTGLASA